MIIGLDFDNTVVDYDALFHRVAVEQRLVPAETAPTKAAVRDYLRSVGQEDAWTELQGTVYGARMEGAAFYPGALEFLRGCRSAGVSVRIISHKTRVPFRGPSHDLHAAAWAWLAAQRVFDTDGAGLSAEHVFFETTKGAKLARIATERCTHFVDDLPEILLHPGFPPGVARILFSPSGEAAPDGVAAIRAWRDAPRVLALPSPCL